MIASGSSHLIRRRQGGVLQLQGVGFLQQVAERSSAGPDELLQDLRQVDGLLRVLLHRKLLHQLVQMQHRTGFKILDQRQKEIVHLNRYFKTFRSHSLSSNKENL